MNKNVKIVIAGQAGSGKTTVCKLIVDALQKEGIQTIIISGEDEVMIEDEYTRRIISLKDSGLTVDMEMVNISQGRSKKSLYTFS